MRAPRKAFGKTFSKPGTFGRKRDGLGGKRPFDDSGTGKGEFTPRKPYPPRGAGFFSNKPRPSDSNSNDRPDRPVRPERAGRDRAGRDKTDQRPSTEGGKRVYRKFDAPRERPPRQFSSDRPKRAGDAAGEPGKKFAPRKPAGVAGGFHGKGTARPGGFARRPGAPDGKSFGKPSGFAGKKPFSKPSGSFAGRKPFPKPGVGFAGKKPFGQASSGPGTRTPGKPAGPFAKFAGGKKPFGKRPPARKFKAREDESA
jgi:hypothetical protein